MAILNSSYCVSNQWSTDSGWPGPKSIQPVPALCFPRTPGSSLSMISPGETTTPGGMISRWLRAARSADQYTRGSAILKFHAKLYRLPVTNYRGNEPARKSKSLFHRRFYGGCSPELTLLCLDATHPGSKPPGINQHPARTELRNRDGTDIPNYCNSSRMIRSSPVRGSPRVSRLLVPT
jgi:hypothetical protein